MTQRPKGTNVTFAGSEVICLGFARRWTSEYHCQKEQSYHSKRVRQEWQEAQEMESLRMDHRW